MAEKVTSFQYGGSYLSAVSLRRFLSSPLSTAGTITALSFSGSVNQGSAVPLKWEILDANGNPISDLSTLQPMQACPTTGRTVPPASSSVPPCVLLYSPTIGAKGNSTFRFSSAPVHFQLGHGFYYRLSRWLFHG